ncbi:M28 family metallopeptidase [Leeuwenhoekiella aestuarii]|uniref:Peptidase M28-like protein n=1 Tax=Leeuwenhoekiella aestuarii TaxID=2249426 RepID=A0A4Q0NR48_9FLAO|nr:M20/M25/M40 family metallo-hydrolase [Leeuwenhoekiella aestuarii]RXG12660.1 peptidase M28-like protein [Leeuwenhoekiella aestuarii]
MRKIIYGLLGFALVACGTQSDVRQVDVNAAAEAAKGYEVSKDASEVIKTTAAPNPSTVSFKKEVGASAVKQHVEFLASDALKGRKTGTTGIDEAATYIIKQFQDAGVQPYFTSYRDKFNAKGVDGYNIVAMLPGTDSEWKNEFIVIGAHYDHIGTAEAVNGDTIANGANDNASGTSAVIELAKYFAKAKTNKRSIIFALFSAEELGLLGSAHLAERLKTNDLNPYVMFNIEMIGVPMTDKDYTVYLTGYENSNMAQKFNAYAGAKVMGFLPQAKQYSLFKRSDNYAFYEEFRIPAQTVSTFDFTNFDHYHQVGDEVSIMDFEHIANVVNQLIPGVEGMANSNSHEIIWNE